MYIFRQGLGAALFSKAATATPTPAPAPNIFFTGLRLLHRLIYRLRLLTFGQVLKKKKFPKNYKCKTAKNTK